MTWVLTNVQIIKSALLSLGFSYKREFTLREGEMSRLKLDEK